MVNWSKIGAAKILDDVNQNSHRGTQSALELTSDQDTQYNPFIQILEDINKKCESFKSQQPWIKKLDGAILVVFLCSLLFIPTLVPLSRIIHFINRDFLIHLLTFHSLKFTIRQKNSKRFHEKLFLKGSINGILPDSMALVMYHERDDDSPPPKNRFYDS